MVTFKLWKDSELIKIQVNFVERILFDHESVVARTLIDHTKISEDDKAYFEDFLKFYKPVKLLAYSKEEILCEKVRAILTRQTQKLRDFYDIFMLEKHGIKIDKLKEMIVEKVRDVLRYKKYRTNLERNVKGLSTKEFIDDPFEKEMFIVKPPAEFYRFVERFVEVLREIGESVMMKS
jgi:predicted nucleotidyltransferase component of viral defense system